MLLNNNKGRLKMIEDKDNLIEDAKFKLSRAEEIVKQNSVLFEECKKYHDLWINNKEGRNAHLAINDIFAGVNLDIILSEDDSMDDFNLFLDELPYEIIATNDFIDGKWIRYEFKEDQGTLHIFCKYGNSKHCKLVETGKTKPIYKRICV